MQERIESAGNIVYVIPRRELPNLGNLFLISFFHGLLVLIVGIALEAMTSISLGVATGISWRELLVFLCIAIAWPAWRLRRRYRTVCTTPRAAWLGFGYGMGIASIPLILATYVAITEASDPTPMFSNPNTPWWVAGISAIVLASSIAIVAGLWRIVRMSLPALVVQDGTLCPQCAYCLLGVQSMRCPECGNAFTYDELETTEAEFRKRTAALRSS